MLIRRRRMRQAALGPRRGSGPRDGSPRARGSLFDRGKRRLSGAATRSGWPQHSCSRQAERHEGAASRGGSSRTRSCSGYRQRLRVHRTPLRRSRSRRLPTDRLRRPVQAAMRKSRSRHLRDTAVGAAGEALSRGLSLHALNQTQDPAVRPTVRCSVSPTGDGRWGCAQ